MDLAKAAYVEDLRAHHTQASETPVAQQAHRREQLMIRLKRLRPGASTVMPAVKAEDGEVRQEPAAMAQALAAHWSKVFAGRTLQEEDIAAWMEAAYPGGAGLGSMEPAGSPAWQIRRDDVDRAVKVSGSSSPGPDGIPYAAWRALGAYGVDTLWDALQELQRTDGTALLEEAYRDETGCHFNLGLMACIPKVTTGVSPGGTAYVSPADTRPISMVDTANRLMANAARLRWESHLGAWISSEQKGFLPHRSLLANVVELEDAAMQVSLGESEGGIMLLDFAAAFPSVSQQFLRAVLAHIGFPASALHFMDALYHKNSCQLQLQGLRFEGFRMNSGIRQGCPLSPLLFITAMDGLIRVLQREVGGLQVNAFADDTAVVFRDLKGDLPKLFDIFGRLARASGLELNMRKCVLIPLGDRAPNAVKAYLERSGSPWFGVHVDTQGRYLGFQVGPGRRGDSWDKPVKKAHQRIGMWDWAKLGLFYSTQVWNIMIVSLFAFVSQLERPPPAVLAVETRLLRKAAPGVGGWCRQSELHRLSRAFGFPGEFRGIADSIEAIHLRVAVHENAQHGGLQLRRRSAALQAARLHTTHPDREFRLRAWYENAHSDILLQSVRALRARGITTIAVEDAAAGTAVRPWTPAQAVQVRRGFQKAARRMALAGDTYDALAWHRRKLERWGFMDRRQAARSLARLKELHSLVPPRVLAAAIGCMWNRWPTSRRKQRRGCQCLLGCGVGEDSVEHYNGCRLTRLAARRWLGMEFRVSLPMEHWMLVAPTCSEVEEVPGWWGRIALLQYAVQRVTNAARDGHRVRLAEVEILRALRQGLLEGARGHHKATTWLLSQPQPPMLA